MRTGANFLWFILNGLWVGLVWCFVGVIAAITIVGLPWAKACFVMAEMTFHPFGREAISRRILTGQEDVGTGVWGLVGNIIWFVLAGAWLALLHVALGVVNFCTIIGIPFGIQHFKLAGLAIAPIGKTIVKKDVAALAAAQEAADAYAAIRGGGRG